MDVQIVFLVKIFFNAQLICNRANITDTCLCGFLHHIAQLTGQNQLAAAGNCSGFNLQGIASYCSPRKSCGNTYLILTFYHIEVESVFSQILFQIGRRNAVGFCLCRDNLTGNLSTEVCNLPFQISDTGLSGVIINQIVDCFLGNLEVILLQSVFLHLLWNQISLSNLYLFFLGVARYFYDFHSVKKRSWNSIG